MSGTVDRPIELVFHDITVTGAPRPRVEHHYGHDDGGRIESVML